MKRIGKGSFTTCFLNDDGKTVTLHSCDPMKEGLALGVISNSRLFPKIERLNYSDNGAVYTMKYYPRVKSIKSNLNPLHYSYYLELREAYDRISYDKLYDASFVVIASFKLIKNRYLRRVMIEAIEACMNYGTDICFEISPRNIAVDKGRLILLDCFFSGSLLRQQRGETD